jgi:uncharacterized repeat protein (TIGR03833 family)
MIWQHQRQLKGSSNTCECFCSMKDGKKRSDVQVGSRVRIVEKKNQASGKLTEGVVRGYSPILQAILTE